MPLQFRMIQQLALIFGRKIILKHFMGGNIKSELVLIISGNLTALLLYTQMGEIIRKMGSSKVRRIHVKKVTEIKLYSL